jgi:hypothetical protein
MAQEETNLYSLWIMPDESVGRTVECSIEEWEHADDLLMRLFEFAGITSVVIQLLVLWVSQARIRTELQQGRVMTGVVIR